MPCEDRLVAGMTDLAHMLRSLEPAVRDGEFVYVSFPGGAIPAAVRPEVMIREDEGVTVVARREDADAAGLAYDITFAWITLSVHSSLEAVGLTAAFSAALGDAGISCNVIAGYYHDHLLVPVVHRDAAIAVLRKLAGLQGWEAASRSAGPGGEQQPSRRHRQASSPAG
jgi:hypothetical protein